MRTQFATLAAGAALLTLTGAMAVAQNGYGGQGGYGNRQGGYQGQQGQYQGQYDDQHWGRGPQGYSNDYPEQNGGQPGARQGWQSGFSMGQSDRQHGHSFRPTQLDEYKHIPDVPRGYNKDQFKNDYRQAFTKGYSRGYGQ